ncbi:MAG: hypothetical protein ACLT9P_01270 [Evtepia gabavorous]
MPAAAGPRTPGKTVAIVGGGPSGTHRWPGFPLPHGATPSWYSSASTELGGVLRYGIPGYRLPGAYLDRDIGCHPHPPACRLRVNCEVGTDVTLEELRRDYDSLYLAIGASLHKGLGIPGERTPEGVLSAIPDAGTSPSAR